MIFVVDYLNSRGVDYKASGKNVGSNDVNIDCLWCGENGQHLGINKYTGQLNCWVCGFIDEERRPSFLDLVMEIEGCPFHEAKKVVEEYSDEYAGDEYGIPPSLNTGKVVLPEEAEDFANPKTRNHRDYALAYLEARGFGWPEINKYNLSFCPRGRYECRVIVPIYYGGVLVTYLGRSYRNRPDENRYDNLPLGKSLMRHKELLYPVDLFSGDSLMLVEGVTDVWRLGHDSLATLGNSMSPEQRAQVIGLELRALSILFDHGSYSIGLGIAEDLSPFISSIKVVEMSKNSDVADLTRGHVLDMVAKTKAMRF